MAGTTFIISFTARPEAASYCCAIRDKVKRDLPGLASCRGMNIFRASDDRSVFTLVDQWDSKPAHQARIDTPAACGRDAIGA